MVFLKCYDKRAKVAQELIDVIFYVLDASRLACPSIKRALNIDLTTVNTKNRLTISYPHQKTQKKKEDCARALRWML
jgi:hypothetical protein